MAAPADPAGRRDLPPRCSTVWLRVGYNPGWESQVMGSSGGFAASLLRFVFTRRSAYFSF